MSLAILLSGAATVFPAIPMGRLRAVRARLNIGEPVFGAAVSAMGAAGYVAGTYDGSVARMAPALTALTVGTLSSIAAVQMRNLLQSEIGKGASASTKTKIGSITRKAWIWRATIAGAMGWDLLRFHLSQEHSLVAWSAMGAAAASSVAMTFAELRHIKDTSDEVHEQELLRYLTWLSETRSSTVIHVPDASAETMRHLQKLTAFLAARGVAAALLCRGRKCFIKVRHKYQNSWLVRTTHDLDDFIIPGIECCLHMPVGTTAGHVVSLRKTNQILVDLEGATAGERKVRKEMRMFDEIWINGLPSQSAIEDAASYGISLVSLLPFSERALLPRVVDVFGHIGVALPDGDDQTVLNYMGEVHRVFDEMRSQGEEVRKIFIMPGAGADHGARACVVSMLTGALGKDNVVLCNSHISLLNSCHAVIAGDWLRSGYDCDRHVIKSSRGTAV